MFSKNLFYCALIIIFLISGYSISISDTKTDYVCLRDVEDHPWWNPLSWIFDYYYVEEVSRSSMGDDGVLHVIHSITCQEWGFSDCPPCYNTIVEQDTILTQDFLNDSHELMESYVLEQISYGNYSGQQSFNTIYNGYTIFRTATWDGDTTVMGGQYINLRQSIIPYWYPIP